MWILTPIAYSPSEVQEGGELLMMLPVLKPTTAPVPQLTLKDDYYVPKDSDKDYLQIQFWHTVEDYVIADDLSFSFKIEVKGPDGVWRTPTYIPINHTLTRKRIHFTSSKTDMYKITEAGNYNVRISMVVTKGQLAGLILNLSTITISTSAIINVEPREPATGPSRRTGRTTVATPKTPSINNDRNGNRPSDYDPVLLEGTLNEDKRFVLRQPNGFERFEAELAFADILRGTRSSTKMAEN